MNNNNNNNNNNFPNIRILNDEENEEDRVPRDTNFVLTINTQQLVTNQMDPVDPQQFDNRYQEVVATVNAMFQELLQLNNEEWGPVNWIDFPGDDGVDNILQPIQIDIAFERIPEGKPNAGRFHLHALIRIRHNSNISIATRRLFEKITDYLADINITPYCYLRFAHSTVDQVLKYMRKDLESGRSNRRNNNNNNNNNYDDDEDF